MVSFKSAAPEVLFCLLMASYMTKGLHAQTCLRLSRAKVNPGDGVSFELSLDWLSGEHPVAVQWTFQYPAESIRSLTVDDGPALAAARKTVLCSGSASAYRCLLVGTNSNVVPSGVVARVTAATAGTRTAQILVNDPLGASADGTPVPVYTESGAITVVSGFSRRESSPPRGQPAVTGPCSPHVREKDK